MTDVSRNLPPGMKPGDSDPPKQKFWTGRVWGEYVIADVVEITTEDACSDASEARRQGSCELGKRASTRNPGCNCTCVNTDLVESDTERNPEND